MLEYGKFVWSINDARNKHSFRWRLSPFSVPLRIRNGAIWLSPRSFSCGWTSQAFCLFAKRMHSTGSQDYIHHPWSLFWYEPCLFSWTFLTGFLLYFSGRRLSEYVTTMIVGIAGLRFRKDLEPNIDNLPTKHIMTKNHQAWGSGYMSERRTGCSCAHWEAWGDSRPESETNWSAKGI